MEENVTLLSLDLIVHPGETIKEALEEKNMTQEELAIRTGYSAKHISEVISGKKDISNKFAYSLEIALGIDASEIIKIEEMNNIKDNEFDILKDLKDIVGFCQKHNIIKNNNSKPLTILNMRKFLNLTDLTKIPDLPLQQVAFRASKKLKVNTYVLYAWKRLCEYLASHEKINKPFNKEKLANKYNDIKNTMFKDANTMVKELKEIFADCGVVFEIVQHFTGAPVNGFIEKQKDKIILCMTIRQSYSDIFWFTLFHEISHLLNEDFHNQFMDYSFVESEIEKRADSFAQNILINEEDYQKFKNNNKYDYQSIVAFANTQKVLPGIVIGRIQRDIDDYTFMTKYKEQYKWVN